ncbi:MAG: type II secretion system F family protein, partial [Planctomycetes bacterium]|nr:type II secretion system F family protein [Planctomycetota bacterium]
MTLQIIILGLIFLSVIFAGLSVWLLVGNKGASTDRIRERLQGVRQVEEYNLGDNLAEREKEKQQKKEEKRKVVKQKAFSNIPALQDKIGGQEWAELLNAQLRQADMPISVAQFGAICFGAGLFGAIITIIWQGSFSLLYTPPAFLILAAAPYLYVHFTVKSRIKKFGSQFPDALDLLSSCVKSGQSLNAAIQNVADEMPDPVADEFSIMADELTFGEEQGKVLEHLRKRLNTEDVQVFCTALMIQKETGGNLSEVLDGLQNTIRERFRILRQVRTLTAQ